MKIVALTLLVVGLLMTLYSGFTYVTKEKVLDVGTVEITKDNEHRISWQPYIGIGLMIAGGVSLVFWRKKSI
jgi:hypothetical protein